MIQFAVTKSELIFELLCRDVAVYNSKSIVMVNLDVLQLQKDEMLSKESVGCWKSRMDPPSNIPGCGIPHPGAKTCDWLTYWFCTNPDMFRCIRALVLDIDLKVKDLKDRYNQSTTSNIYEELRRSKLIDIVARRGQTLEKKGTSGQ